MVLLRPKDAAKMLGVTTTTLRAMDKRGELLPVRTSGNQRRFNEDDVKKLMGIREVRVVAIYARVSSQGQKDDLKRQIELLKSKYIDAELYTDICSGLKFDRKGFEHLLQSVQSHRISKVVIVHKDRLARFGFDLLEKVFSGYGTVIEVIELDAQTSPQDELVKDLISIITSFSARLYGLRSHKTKKILSDIKKELNSNVN